ncbi:MAG: response regulator [Pseudomonadales bacterium]|nr:response regulator [Pseudomonadales bacterium]
MRKSALINEKQRLDALLSYDILDTQNEQEFDDLVQQAAYICQTPIAAITLVDETRQWFKASIGLDAKETPRAMGFCSCVIKSKKQLIIEDARKNKRFCNNPMVTGEPHIRFYAGSPLISPDGFVIGSLCVIDQKVRTLTLEQQDLLTGISRQIIAQLELRSSNKALRESNEKLINDQQLLQQSNLNKTYFLSKMSHEIRTPLNGILGMAEVLQGTDLAEQQAHYTQVIINSSRTLYKLINNILDFSLIDNDKLQIENLPFNLESMLTSITDIFRFQLLSKGLAMTASIEPGTPIFLLGDETRIQQVMTNFIANACKFTQHGDVVIRLSNQDRNPTASHCQLYCSVSDTGCGIEPAEVENIFDEFYQIKHPHQGNCEGIGIGLAICKQLVKRMGGDIGVYNNQGQGACFWFTVPLEIAKAEEEEQSYAHIDLHDKRLLVVDDNKTYCNILQEQATAWGMDVNTANGANEAMSMLYQALSIDKPFDLLVLDFDLPQMDGMELSRVIQQNSAFVHTPRLLISCTSHLPCDNDLREAGIDKAQLKPAAVSQFNKVFAQLLGLHEKTTIASEIQEISTLSGQGRVLIADDNAVNRIVLEGMLEKLSLRFDGVENGQKALSLYTQNHQDYQLILMDCDMPVMDGYAAATAIRLFEQENHIKAIPIIAVTAYAMAGDIKKCLDVGMNEHIAKPIRMRSLAKVISQLQKNEILGLHHIKPSTQQAAPRRH